MSPRTFLLYGLLAGLIAGFLSFGASFLLGEPHIDAAIAVEEAAAEKDHAHEEGAPAHSHGEESSITRAQQATGGLATATVAIGVALGGIAGIAAAFALGRIGRLRPAASTALVVGVGFVAFALAAWAKYPPNPPAVGSGETIRVRTAAYFGFQALSVLLAVGAVALGARLARRGDGWVASVVPALGWLVLVTVTGLVLPSAEEVPAAFPADTLWGFRFSSLVVQAVLWGTIAVVLSGLVQRATRAAEARRALADSVRT